MAVPPSVPHLGLGGTCLPVPLMDGTRLVRTESDGNGVKLHSLKLES